MTPSPPRDPDNLEPSKHFGQMIKERNIGAFEVKQAVRDGKVEPARGEDEFLYRLEIPGVDLIVIVDADTMTYETAYYDDEQGAEGGVL